MTDRIAEIRAAVNAAINRILSWIAEHTNKLTLNPKTVEAIDWGAIWQMFQEIARLLGGLF